MDVLYLSQIWILHCWSTSNSTKTSTSTIQVNLYTTSKQEQVCKKYFHLPEGKLCLCSTVGRSLCPVWARLASVFCVSETVLHSGHFSTYQRQCETEGHRPHSVAIVSSDKRAAWLTAQPTTHIFFSLMLANALLSAQSPLLCGLVFDMCSRSLVHISRVSKGPWFAVFWRVTCATLVDALVFLAHTIEKWR